MPPVNDPPAVCAGGDGMTNDHLAGCTKMRRGPLTLRHDEMVYCIKRKVQQLGAAVPLDPKGSSCTRPDLQISHPVGQYIVEVSVHPQAPTYQVQVSKGVGVPIQYRENQKRAKYKDLVQQEG